MKISKESRTKARQLFGACCVDGVVEDRRARTVVARLKAERPRGFLPILTQFVELVRLNYESNCAVVESVSTLDEASKTQIEAQIHAKHGKHIDISYKQNAELIGGTRIRVGSQVYDSSVKARLQCLSSQFSG